MKVLVTGASGLFGGRLAGALRQRGDRLTVLQRRPSGLSGVREIRGDLADLGTLRRAADGQDAVVHLAAKVDVVGRWADYLQANVEGTANLIEACRTAGVRRMVHVSSPSVAHGGRSLVGVGATAADPAAARGPYAKSKAMAERLALAADGPQLAVLAVRPHLVWGPGDRQLVARIVQRARAGRLPVIGSGAALVDTTFLDNAVDALVAALDADRVHGIALVISNGEPRPIGELIEAICRAHGVSAPTRRVPTGLALVAGGVAQSAWALRHRSTAGSGGQPPMTRFLVEQLSTAHWFDQRSTRALLRWAPKVSIDEGMARLAAAARGEVG